jgi:hypothetical protein
MFKIIYKTVVFEYKFLNRKEKLYAGTIVCFKENRIITTCDSKSVPCGIVARDSLSIYSSQIPVLIGPLECSTDIYEPSDYKINDFLYCSDNGKITNDKKYRGNIIVGLVNSVEKDRIGFVTILARGLEEKSEDPRYIKEQEDFFGHYERLKDPVQGITGMQFFTGMDGLGDTGMNGFEDTGMKGSGDTGMKDPFYMPGVTGMIGSPRKKKRDFLKIKYKFYS